MNKKTKSITDNSTPYRNLGIGKITAPAKSQNEPRSRVIKGTGDLRCRGNKS